MRIAQSTPSASRVVIRALLLATAAGAGCSRNPGPPPPPAWPDELAPQDITFGDPEVDRQFREIDAATRRLAGPTWKLRDVASYRRNGNNLSAWRYYDAMWASGLEPEFGGTTATNPLRPWVKIRLNFGEGGDFPLGGTGEKSFTLDASHRNAHGLIARVYYCRIVGTPGVTGTFRIHFQNAGDGKSYWANGDGYHIGRCVHSFSYSRDADDLHFYFHVQNRCPGEGEVCRGVDPQDVIPYWRSAEAFRNKELAVLDGLMTDAKAGLGRGPIDSVRVKTGAEPAHWPKVNKPVPEAIRADVLRNLESDVETRRAIVREHFREMHAVATAAFPELGAILESGQKK